jgi:hypothetical protein
MKIDPALCCAIGTVLFETGGRAVTARAITTFITPYVRVAATVADVSAALFHLEQRGDVRRIADPDEPSILSWTLTDAGKIRFPN